MTDKVLVLRCTGASVYWRFGVLALRCTGASVYWRFGVLVLLLIEVLEMVFRWWVDVGSAGLWFHLLSLLVSFGEEISLSNSESVDPIHTRGLSYIKTR
jgi:hypothetical protein